MDIVFILRRIKMCVTTENKRKNLNAFHTHKYIYNKPTRCNSGSIVFINYYKYAVHVSDALCVHHQEHYKL